MPNREISKSQIIADSQRIRVISPPHTLTLSQHLLKQLNRLTKTPNRAISVSQIIADSQHIRVISPQNLLTLSQHLLKQLNRLTKTPNRAISGSQIIADSQRIRVIRPQNIFNNRNSHIKLNCFIYKPKIIGILESTIQVTSNLFTLKQKARVILNSDSAKLRNKITSFTTPSMSGFRR